MVSSLVNTAGAVIVQEQDQLIKLVSSFKEEPFEFIPIIAPINEVIQETVNKFNIVLFVAVLKPKPTEFSMDQTFQDTQCMG